MSHHKYELGVTAFVTTISSGRQVSAPDCSGGDVRAIFATGPVWNLTGLADELSKLAKQAPTLEVALTALIEDVRCGELVAHALDVLARSPQARFHAHALEALSRDAADIVRGLG